ncbi:MAG: 50S ribosomal protein L25 [Planctomycetota bacterium]
MEISTIQVERREATGKKKMKQLRADGRIPAVLYGGGRDTLHLTVGAHDMTMHLRHHHKVFRLEMGGQDQPIFLQSVQWDCLTDRPIHIDFLRIDLNKPMRLVVELGFLGHPVGLSKGGRLVPDLKILPIRCLPAAIPEIIEVQVGPLDLGDSITAADLQLPEGVEVDLRPEALICHVPGEIEGAEVDAEGEEGEGAGEA